MEKLINKKLIKNRKPLSGIEFPKFFVLSHVTQNLSMIKNVTKNPLFSLLYKNVGNFIENPL